MLLQQWTPPPIVFRSFSNDRVRTASPFARKSKGNVEEDTPAETAFHKKQDDEQNKTINPQRKEFPEFNEYVHRFTSNVLVLVVFRDLVCRTVMFDPVVLGFGSLRHPVQRESDDQTKNMNGALAGRTNMIGSYRRSMVP